MRHGVCMVTGRAVKRYSAFVVCLNFDEAVASFLCFIRQEFDMHGFSQQGPKYPIVKKVTVLLASGRSMRNFSLKKTG